MIITCPNCTTRYSLPQDKIKPGGQKVRCAKCGTVWHQAPEDEPIALTVEDEVAPPTPEPAWAPAMPAEPAPAAVPPIMPSPAERTPASPADQPAPEPPMPAAPVAAADPAPAAAPVTPGMTAPGGFARLHVPSSNEQAAERDGTGRGRKIAIAVVILVILALGALVLFRQQVQELTGIPLMPNAAPKSPETAAAPAAPAQPVEAAAPLPPEPMTLSLEEVESYTEETEGIKRLVVKGVISNFGDREQVIPKISFELRDKDGNRLDLWVFDPPQSRLAPHLRIKFEKSRELPPQALYDLNPAFYDETSQQPATPDAAAAETSAGAASAPTAGTPTASQPATAPSAQPAASAATASRPTAAPSAGRPPTSQQTPAPSE